jgi:hypothetical protein
MRICARQCATAKGKQSTEIVAYLSLAFLPS